MKQLIMTILKKSMVVGRIGLVVFGLMALLVCGASSVHRLQSSTDQKIEPAGLPDQVCLTSDPSGEETKSENMTPGSNPNSEPTAILTQAILTGGLGSQDSSTDQRLDISEGSIQTTQTIQPRARLASLSLVNSSLGRQFTLVGAKPSGTG